MLEKKASTEFQFNANSLYFDIAIQSSLQAL